MMFDFVRRWNATPLVRQRPPALSLAQAKRQNFYFKFKLTFWLDPPPTSYTIFPFRQLIKSIVNLARAGAVLPCPECYAKWTKIIYSQIKVSSALRILTICSHFNTDPTRPRPQHTHTHTHTLTWCWLCVVLCSSRKFNFPALCFIYDLDMLIRTFLQVFTIRLGVIFHIFFSSFELQQNLGYTLLSPTSRLPTCCFGSYLGSVLLTYDFRNVCVHNE